MVSSVSGVVTALCFLLSVRWNLSGAHTFSDFKLCADEECNAIMSHVKALKDYEAPDCRYLSFKTGDRIEVFMKLTGESDYLWAGSLQERIGLFPKDVVKEVPPFTKAKEVKLPSTGRDFQCLDGEYDGQEDDRSVGIEDNSAELALDNAEVQDQVFVADTSSEENVIDSREIESNGVVATVLGWFGGGKTAETGPAADDAAGSRDADLLSHGGTDQGAPGGTEELANGVPQSQGGDGGAVSSKSDDVTVEQEHEASAPGDEIANVPPAAGGFFNDVQSLVSGFNFFGSKPALDDKPADTGGIVASERSEEVNLPDHSTPLQHSDESPADASVQANTPADAPANPSNDANVEAVTKDHPQLPSAEPRAEVNTLALTEESNGGDISVPPDTSSTGDRGGKVDSADDGFYGNAKWALSRFGMYPDDKATGQIDGAKQVSTNVDNPLEQPSNAETSSEKAISEETASAASEILPVAGHSPKGPDPDSVSGQDDAVSQADNRILEAEVHGHDHQIEITSDEGNGGDISSQRLQDTVEKGDGEGAKPLNRAENQSPRLGWLGGFWDQAQQVTKLFKRKRAQDETRSHAEDVVAPGELVETNGHGQPTDPAAAGGGMVNESDHNENILPEPTPISSSQIQDGIGQEANVSQAESHVQNETKETTDVDKGENGDLVGDLTSFDAITTESRDSVKEVDGIILSEQPDMNTDKQDATLHREKVDSAGLSVESEGSDDTPGEVGDGSAVSDDALLSTDSDRGTSTHEATEGTVSAHEDASVTDTAVDNDGSVFVTELPPSQNEDRDRSSDLVEDQLSSDSVTGDNAITVDDGSDLKESEQASLEEFANGHEESSLELNANQPFQNQIDSVDDGIAHRGTEAPPKQTELGKGSQHQFEGQLHAMSIVEDSVTNVDKITLHGGADDVESVFEMSSNGSQPEDTQAEAFGGLSFQQTEAAPEGDGLGEARSVEEAPLEQNEPEEDSSQTLEGNVHEETTFTYHDGAAKDEGVDENETSAVHESQKQALEPENVSADNFENEHHKDLTSKPDTADVESDGNDENTTSSTNELLQKPRETESVPSDPHEESDVQLHNNDVERNRAEEADETSYSDETPHTKENEETPADQVDQQRADPREDLILNQEDNALERDSIKESLPFETPANPLVTEDSPPDRYEDHIGEGVNSENVAEEEVQHEDTVSPGEVDPQTVNEPEDDSTSLNEAHQTDFSDEPPREFGTDAEADAETEYATDGAQFVPEPEGSGTAPEYADTDFYPALTDPELVAGEGVHIGERATWHQRDNVDTGTVIGSHEVTGEDEAMDNTSADAGNVDILGDGDNLAHERPALNAVEANDASTGAIVEETDNAKSDGVAVAPQDQEDGSESETAAPIRDVGTAGEGHTEEDLVPEISVAENAALTDTRDSQDAGEEAQTLATKEAEVLHGAPREREEHPGAGVTTSGESQAVPEEPGILKEHSHMDHGNDDSTEASHVAREKTAQLDDSETSESIARVERALRSYMKGLSESLDEPRKDVGVGTLPVPWLISRLDHLLLRAAASIWPSLAPVVTLMVPDWVCPSGVKNAGQFTPLAMAALGALGASSLLLAFTCRLCSAVKNRRYLSREAKLMSQVAALLQDKSALALEISECTQKLTEKQAANVEQHRQADSLSGRAAELRESNAELRRVVAELRSDASEAAAELNDARSGRELEGRRGDQVSPTKDEEDEGKENEDLASKLVEAEQLLAAALSRVGVLAATLQATAQSRDSIVGCTEQLETEELRRRREEVGAVRRDLEEARAEQAALEAALVAKCSEHQMLCECRQQLELLSGSALGGDGTGDACPLWGSSEHHATNAMLMTATIERVEGETRRLGEQLLSEERATQELRDRASRLQAACAAAREHGEQGRRDAEAMRVRLQLLADMHRGTDASLQRELTEKENSGQTKASACSEAEQKALQAMEEATQYKQLVSDLKKELRQTEITFKDQISTQEKEIHEQWFAARKAEKELAEMKKDISVLQRLSEKNGGTHPLVHPTPSRPLATQGGAGSGRPLPSSPLRSFPPEPANGFVADRRRSSLTSPGPPQHSGPHHHGSNTSLSSTSSLDVDNDRRLAVVPPRRPSSHCGAPLSPPPTLGGSFTEPSAFRPRRGGPPSPHLGAPRWSPAAPWGPLMPPAREIGLGRNSSPLMDPRMRLLSSPPPVPLPPLHRGYLQPAQWFPPPRDPAMPYGGAPPYDSRHVPRIQGRASQADGLRSPARSPPPGPPRQASTPK